MRNHPSASEIEKWNVAAPHPVTARARPPPPRPRTHPALDPGRDQLRMIAIAALVGLACKVLAVGEAMVPQGLAGIAARLLATCALTFLVGAFLCLVPSRFRTPVALLFNALCSMILLGDLWHARYFGDALSIARVALVGQLTVVPSSVIVLPRLTDLAVVADLVVLAGWAWATRARPQLSNPRAVRPALLCLACASLSACVLWLMQPQRLDEVFEYEYSFEDIESTLGVAGYHALDVTTVLSQILLRHLRISQSDVVQIQDWFEKHHRSRRVSPLAGA